MESSLITVTTWTSNSIVNATTTTRSEESDAKNVTTVDREFEPLSVFAQVLRGGSPVLGARVLMTVEIEQANGSVLTLSPVPLSDDGFGGKNHHFNVYVRKKERESKCVRVYVCVYACV